MKRLFLIALMTWMPHSAFADEGTPWTVDLNQASVQALQRLPGVGPARAEAIVALRRKRRFRRIEDIMRVRGIGRKTFRRLRPHLRVGEVVPDERKPAKKTEHPPQKPKRKH